MRSTIWLFVETLVIFHIQRHVTDLAFETSFVPQFVEAFDFFNWVDSLVTLGTFFRVHLVLFYVSGSRVPTRFQLLMT